MWNFSKGYSFILFREDILIEMRGRLKKVIRISYMVIILW